MAPPPTAQAASASTPVWWTGTFTFRNAAKWTVHHIFLSPKDQDEWGPDQLGQDALDPGDELKLTGVECETYDVKVVDKDGDECVLQDVDLCQEDLVWEMTSKDLLVCQGID